MPGSRTGRTSGTSGASGASRDDSPQRRRPPADEEPRQRAPAGDSGDEGDEAQDEDRSSAARRSRSRPAPAAAARAAITAIAELIGREPESITALERTEDGWHVAVEVLEDQRVPSSADVLATYEADLDPDGSLIGYRRTSRYLRGRADASRDG